MLHFKCLLISTTCERFDTVTSNPKTTSYYFGTDYRSIKTDREQVAPILMVLAKS